MLQINMIKIKMAVQSDAEQLENVPRKTECTGNLDGRKIAKQLEALVGVKENCVNFSWLSN